MIAGRLTLTAVVSLCSFAGALLFSVPVALAAAPPVVEEEAVLDVAGTSATLQAKIDPEENETTYRFEYGTSEAYGSSIPIPDGFVGSDSAGVTVSAHPQDLLPSTEYHYRVVALVASRDETVPGNGGTFTTQSADGEFALPDGRQWELVSPPNKHGALISSLAETGPLQASADGDGIVYQTDVPIEPEPQGYEIASQDLSARGAQGWSTLDISTPHNSVTGSNLPKPEYQFFSEDLSLGLADPVSEDDTLLSAQASEPTPYLRRRGLCEVAATVSECFLPLVTAKEGFADVPSGLKFKNPVFEGASPDLSRVLLKSETALTPTPIPTEELYEWSSDVPAAEALQMVSILPESEGGGPYAGSGYVGVGPDISQPWSGARHALSNDGSRVFWEAGDSILGERRLYMRDTAKGETVALDVQQPGAPSGGTPEPIFQIASSDGSKVFFTDKQRLTAQSGEGQYWGDLYECEISEVAGKLTCKLTDLTPEINGQSAEVQNMVSGASEDGSYVYFVANGVLGDGAEHGATRGSCEEFGPSSATCNLYEYHEGVTTFIATLSDDDEDDWGGEDQVFHNVGRLTARVSPNGRYLAFMSDRSLTGYDNFDANSGKPDMEVYLYDAQTKRLACVSCNPTGSRPVGVEDAEVTVTGSGALDLADILEGQGETFGGEDWIAANLPTGNKLGVYGESLYQPRLLSNSGRLFFNSSDALVPQDINGEEDVYEFEPEGTGSCTASSVMFSHKSGGCVALISSGASSEEAGFLDASEGGGDVFFLTGSKLVPRDVDTSLDVYDAHECTAAAPCVSQPVSPPPCDTVDSCKAAVSPQPPIFGAPASATFTGAGNLVGAPPGRVGKGSTPRSLTRAQKLTRALKVCKKKPKKKRTMCKKQARKRYGGKTAAKTTRTIRKNEG